MSHPNGVKADTRAQGVVSAQQACGHPECGQPRSTPGRPRRGWVQLHCVDGSHDVWCCSWYCAGVHCRVREIRGGTPGPTPEDHAPPTPGSTGRFARWHRAGKHDDLPHPECPLCPAVPE